MNVPKAFEKSLLSAQVKDGLEPFIDYVNQSFDQIIRAFLNQITLAENVRGKQLSISAKHRQFVQIDTDKQRPSGIIILNTSSPIRSWSWTSLSSGFTQISFAFDEPVPLLTRELDATNSLLYFQSPVYVIPGDRVSVSGFGNKANNDDFLVTDISSNNLKFDTSSAVVSESKAATSGSLEQSKTIDLFILY